MFISAHSTQIIGTATNDDILDLLVTEKLKPPGVLMKTLLKN